MKKINLHRIFGLLLAAFLLAALCGCGSGPKGAEGTNGSSASAGATGSVSNAGAASSQPEGPAYTVAEDSPLACLPLYEYDPF